MIKINIALDSDLLQRLANRMPGLFGEGVAPETKAAFRKAVKMIKADWKGWAMGGPIEGIASIKVPNQKLAASIQDRTIGPFDAEVFTESSYAQRIQNGTPELDMKTTHPFGPRSRVAKSGPNEGFPYVIVPFRWGTPNKQGGPRAHFSNFIPVPMFNAMKKMKTSKRLTQYDKKGNIIGGETHFENNYAGEDIERSDYLWGGRYKGEGNMNGMVRMAGGGGYFTFRVISAAQLVTMPYGWIRKPVDPIDVVGALARQARPIVEDLIQAGLEADIGPS
jgi:hypothetical protein